MGREACTAVATNDVFTCALTASKLRQPHMPRLNSENTTMKRLRNSMRRRVPTAGRNSRERVGSPAAWDASAPVPPDSFTISPRLRCQVRPTQTPEKQAPLGESKYLWGRKRFVSNGGPRTDVSPAA